MRSRERALCNIWLRLCVFLLHQETGEGMATRKQFAEAEHAALYNKYRPKADPKVLEKIIDYLKEKVIFLKRLHIK